jgi:hypothetical protein
MPRTPLRYRAKRPYLKVAIVVVVILLLFLMLPLPLSFNRTLVTNGVNPVQSQITTIDSAWISGTWSTSGAGSTTLAIESADGAVAYNDSVGFGTFSFYAPDAPYTAIVYSTQPVTVQISGSAWGPLIPVGLP